MEKRHTRLQTMDHTELGESFELANLCDKNKSNVHLF